MVILDFDSSVPLVDQIVGQLRVVIARGGIAVGDELPPVRQLAADLGVNLNTVARAYRELQAAGMLSMARGRGRGTRLVADTDARTLGRERRSAFVLGRALQSALADARLAGVDRAQAQRLMQEALEEMYRTAPDPNRADDHPDVPRSSP